MKILLLLLICLNISFSFSEVITDKPCDLLYLFFRKYGYDIRDHCCKNNRIICTANNDVTEINIHVVEVKSMDFSTFPILKNLKKLKLTGDIYKDYTLPSRFFEMPNLSILDVSESNIGTVPNNINAGSPITELYLQGNRLQSLPFTISKFNNLKILNVNSNHLSVLKVPYNAIKVYIKNNLLDTVIVDFANLPLEELDAYNNFITREAFDEIVWLKKLKKLNLSTNPDLESVPNNISQLTQLEELNMSKTKITSLPEGIFQLSNLVNFDISDNPQLNAVVKNFGNIISHCNFVNTNIKCYAANTCSFTDGKLSEINYYNCESVISLNNNNYGNSNYNTDDTYRNEDNSNYNYYNSSENDYNTDKHKDEDDSNNKNMVIFLIIGISLFILLLIVMVIVCCCISHKKKLKKNDKKLKSSNSQDDSSSNNTSSNSENNSSSNDNSSNLENVSSPLNSPSSNPEDASSSISDRTLNDTIPEVENEERNLSISFSNASQKNENDENSLLKNKSLSMNNNSCEKSFENNGLENGVKSLNLNDDNNDIDVVVDVSMSKNSEKKKEIIVRVPQVDSYTPTAPPAINYDLPSAPLITPSNIEPTAPPSVDINNNNGYHDQRITVNDPIMDDSIQEVILSPKLKEVMSPTLEATNTHYQRNSVSDPIMDDSIQEKVLSRSVSNINDNNNNYDSINNNNINDDNNNGDINGNNNNNNNDNNNDNSNNNYNINNESIYVDNTGVLPPYTIPSIQNYFVNNSNEQGIHNIGSVRPSESFSYISEDQNVSVQLSNSNSLISNNNDNTVSNNNSVQITTTNNNNTNGDNDNDNNGNDNNDDIIMGECTILPSYSELLRNHIIRRPSYQD